MKRNTYTIHNPARHHEPNPDDDYAPGEVKVTKVSPDKLDEFLNGQSFEPIKKHRGRPAKNSKGDRFNMKNKCDSENNLDVENKCDAENKIAINKDVNVGYVPLKNNADPEFTDMPRNYNPIDNFNFDFSLIGRETKCYTPALLATKNGTLVYINKSAYTILKSPKMVKVGIDFTNRCIIVIPLATLAGEKKFIEIHCNKNGRACLRILKSARKRLRDMGLTRCEGKFVDGNLLFRF